MEIINTRCPSCGNSTLFIGTGGWITCSFKECRQPIVDRRIREIECELAEAKDYGVKLNAHILKLQAKMDAMAELFVSVARSLELFRLYKRNHDAQARPDARG